MAGEDELKTWLGAHGLSACAQVLVDNAVDLEILPDLSDQDLASIGLVLGLRRKLLKAAASLRAPEPAPAAPTRPTAPERPQPGAGERRYVTIMFSDLVGSTKIAAEMDAEEWRDLVAAYHAAVAAAVEPLGGNVAQKMGDGAMIYFGYPRAQENDAERAVRAGLGIFAGLAELNRRLAAQGKPPLAARVGMHSGPVVVDGGEFAFGDVPNVAARVQTAAEPGQVLISDAVHRQVAGLFIVEDRGVHALKGVAGPMQLWRVQRASGASRRPMSRRAATRFVGRDDELRMLANRWERVKTGETRLVMLIGDAGIGKSRLLDEFRATLAGTPHTWAEWPCAQLLQRSPFHPVVEWVRQRFGGPDVPADHRFADLETTLGSLGLDLNEAIPLIAPLLDLPLPERYQALAINPEESWRRQLAAMAAWVTTGARTQPLVLVLEDAQWSDPSTLELIGNLVEQDTRVSLLVLVTARPEFQPVWPLRNHHERLVLAPLAKSDAADLVESLALTRRLAPETVDAVVQRGGGVPLFLEEVTRLLLEGGNDEQGHQIPPTLHASLLARLDRLGPVKEIAQIGSVLGREFDWPLIHAVSGIGDDQLTAMLDRLAEADMIHAQGRPPEATYRFNQALFQDVAYDSLLKSRRRELHEEVARALVESFPDMARTRPELLAHHLTEAGNTEAAVAAWQRAGEAAMARGAFVEASAHFDHGIRLLKTLPNAAERASDEFQLRSALAQCYWAHKGFGASETRAAFEAALAVGETLGDARTLATVLSGLVAALTQQAEFAEAQSFADRLSALTERPASGAFERGWAALRKGTIRFYAGDLIEARRLFEVVRGLASEGAATAIGGVSLVGMAAIYRPWLAAMTDDAPNALAYADEGLRACDASGSPHNRAFALTGAVIAGLQLGNSSGTADRLKLLLALTEEHHLRVLRSSAVLFEAWATLQSGHAAGAVAQFFYGLRDYTIIGQKVLLNWFTALYADAVAATGDLDQALSIADQAIGMRRFSPLYGPEALRIKSEILAAKARTLAGSEADGLLRQSESFAQEAAAEAKRMGSRLYRGSNA